MTTTNAEEYVPPARGDVVTVASERVGVTNGLLLKFPQIHGVGDLSLLERPRIAIVGARKATQEGRRRAAQLARDCVRAGVVVVSGLAEGIDYAAHTAAIEHGGARSRLLERHWTRSIPRSTASSSVGSITSTSCFRRSPGATSSCRRTFRNETGSWRAFALATVIIEASDTSGSLHQAVESAQVGHPVFIAAGMLEDPKLTWPKRFIGDDKPLGRVLRNTSDVIDFALAT